MTVSLQDTRDPLNANDADLQQSVFEDLNLSNSRFTNANLSDTRLNNVNLSRVSIEDANPIGMTIHGVKVTDLFAAYEKLKG